MKKRKIIAKLMVLSMIISNVSGINVQATENINLPNDNIIYNDNFEAENRETFEGDNVNENLISHETVENDDLISNENEIVEDRKGHDRRYGIDPTKIKEELGWYPETTFEVGIKKTIQWYLDNQEWMKNITSGEYMNYYNEMYK